MLRAGIRNNDPEGLWLWLEYLEELSFNMKGSGKTAIQMRKKFFEGLPEWFDAYVASERMTPNPGSYVEKANYPTHHPKAGTANPKSGEPDMHALVTALDPIWRRKVRTIKSAPRGMVYQTQQTNDDCYECDEASSDDANHDDDDQAETHNGTANAVARSNITAAFICLVCGGRGHAASVDGVECLTKQLGISIPRQELAATKYPNGLKFPSIPSNGSKQRESPRYTTRHDGSSSRDESRRNTSRDGKQGVKIKDKQKYVKRNARESREPPQSSSESSDAAGEHTAKFAVAYHTIDTSGKYNSTREDRS